MAGLSCKPGEDVGDLRPAFVRFAYIVGVGTKCEPDQSNTAYRICCSLEIGALYLGDGIWL